MSADFEAALCFLDITPETVTKNDLLSVHERQRRQLSLLKKRTIAVHDLVSKCRETNIINRHTEKRNKSLNEECHALNDTCKKYKDLLETHEEVLKEKNDWMALCHQQQLELQRRDIKDAARASYDNQMQQLLKDRDNVVEALTLELNLLKDSHNIGCKKRIARLSQILTAITKNLALVADVVFTKRILNRREKMILCKYMRMNKVLTNNKNRERICDLVEEAHNSDNEIIISDYIASEAEETVEEDNDLVKSAIIDEPDNGNESDNAISEDTGRGSSLACSDKDFLSPVYSVKSPSSVESVKDKNKDVDSLDHNTPTQSPKYVKKTKEIATSPININKTDQKKSSSPVKAISKILLDQATSPLKFDSPSRTDIPDIVVTIDDALNDIEQLPSLDENDNLEGIEPLSPVTKQQHSDKHDYLCDENSNDGEIEFILENMRVSRDLITPIPVTPARSISRAAAVSKVNNDNDNYIAKIFDDVAEIKNMHKNNYNKIADDMAGIKKEYKDILKELAGFREDFSRMTNMCQSKVNIIQKCNDETISVNDIHTQEVDCTSLGGDPVIITVNAEKEPENEQSGVIQNSKLPKRKLFNDKLSHNEKDIEIDSSAEEDPIIINYSTEKKREQDKSVVNPNSKPQQHEDLSQNEETIEMDVIDTTEDEDPIIINFSAETEREKEKVAALPKFISPQKVQLKANPSQIEEIIETDVKDTKKTTEQSPNKQDKKRNKKLTKLEKLRKNLLPKSKIKMHDLLPSRKLCSSFKVPIKNQENKRYVESLKNKEAFEKAVKILAEEKLKPGNISMTKKMKKNNLNSSSLYFNRITSRNSNVMTCSNNSNTGQTNTKKHNDSSNNITNGESTSEPVSGDLNKKSKRPSPLKKVEAKIVQSRTEGVETRRRRSSRLSMDLNDSITLPDLESPGKDEMPNRKKSSELVQLQTEGVETRRRRSSRLSTELNDLITLEDPISVISDEVPNRKKSGGLVESQTEGVETRQRRISRLSELHDSVTLAELKSLGDEIPENSTKKCVEISSKKYETCNRKMSQGIEYPCIISPNRKASDNDNQEKIDSTEVLALTNNGERRKSLTPEFDSIKVSNRKKYPSFSLDKDVIVVLEHSDVRENLEELENDCTDKHEPNKSTRAIQKCQSEEQTESSHSQRILRSSVRPKLEDKGPANIIKRTRNRVDSAVSPRPEEPNNLPSIVSYTDLDLFSDEPAPKKQRLDDKPLETSETIDTSKPHESILCKVIEKYGIHGLKRYPSKIPEAVANSVYEKIEKGISRINEIPLNNNKPEMDKLAGDLNKLEHTNFLAGLIKYLADPQRKLELFNKITTPPSPPMTKSEQVVIYLIMKLKEAWPDVVNLVLNHIEYYLFKLNAAPEFDAIGSMAHFYAVLCRYIDSKSRLKLFMFASMYAYNFKAMTVIKQCLEVWMHTLPLAHMGIAKCPLVTITVYLLHFYKPKVDTYNVVQDIRHILSHKYFYKVTEWNEQRILDMCKSSIVDLKEDPVEKKMLRLALILLAKRQGPRWCQTKLVTNMLQPLIYKDGVSETAKAFCVSILGALVKPYPVSMKVHCEIILNQLLDILLSTNPSPVMQEALFTSMISLYRHNQNSVIKAMLQWYPDSVSQGLGKMLKEFVREKTISTWKRLLRQIYLEGQN